MIKTETKTIENKTVLCDVCGENCLKDTNFISIECSYSELDGEEITTEHNGNGHYEICRNCWFSDFFNNPNGWKGWKNFTRSLAHCMKTYGC